MPETPLTVARYVAASQGPPRTVALPVAEKVSEALQSLSDGAAVFTGKSADGRPLAGHRHASVFCEAGPGDGRIRHVTVHAPMGFDDRALDALSRLVKVWSDRGGELWLVLAGIGRRQDFAGRNAAAGRCPLLDAARAWVSHTPFVPTRHPKARHTGEPKLDERGLQIGSPEHDLRRLLGHRFPEPVRLEPLGETVLAGRRTPWSAFRTVRTGGGGRRSTGRGYGFRLEFPRPVRGPIAVGYGAHFGLGTFTPAAEDPAAEEVR